MPFDLIFSFEIEGHGNGWYRERDVGAFFVKMPRVLFQLLGVPFPFTFPSHPKKRTKFWIKVNFSKSLVLIQKKLTSFSFLLKKNSFYHIFVQHIVKTKSFYLKNKNYPPLSDWHREFFFISIFQLGKKCSSSSIITITKNILYNHFV